MVKKISEGEFKGAVEKGISIVDFSASWCGPCKMLAPVVEEVSEELAGKANFLNLDVDECPSLAQEFQIQSVPLLVALKDGKKVGEMIGFRPKEAVKDWVLQYI